MLETNIIVGGNPGRKPRCAAIFLLIFGLLAALTSTSVAVVYQWVISPNTGQPIGITYGPDGAFWFTQYSSGQIGRVTTNDIIQLFGGVSSNSQPYGITLGPDNNLWFTEWGSNQIGRVTVTNTPSNGTNITTVGITTVATLATNSSPAGITTGPDNRLWFVEQFDSKVGALTTNGVLTEYSQGITSNVVFTVLTNGIPYPYPASNYLYDIVSGPDGNLWFTETTAGKLGRINPTTGNVQEFQLPGTNCEPLDIIVGPDNALWFTEFNSNSIGRVSITGTNAITINVTNSLTEFATPTAYSEPFGLAAGRDGNIWFTEYAADQIGRLQPNGLITEYAPFNPNSLPDDMVPGPNGTVWLTESGGAIGVVSNLDYPLNLTLSTNLPFSAGLTYGALFATFTDTDPINTNNVPADYLATISWGVGITNYGIITTNASGGFNVYGTNTYAVAGVYPVYLAVEDINTTFDDGGATAVASTFIGVGPNLTITNLGTGQVAVSWPANFPGLIMETNGDLGTTNWGTNATSPPVVGGRYTITNPATSGDLFYRLVK